MLYLKKNNLINNFKLLNFFLIISLLFGVGAFNTISSFYLIIINFIILKRKDFNYYYQKWFIASLILYLLFMFSSLLSDYREIILIKSITYLRFPLLALCIQYSIKNKNNFIFILKLLFFLTLFVSLDTLVQYIFGVNLFGNNLIDENINRRRLTGIFGSEEIVGAFLIKFFIIGLIYLNINTKINKLVPVIFYLFFGYIILITQERMAFLLYALASFLLVLYLLSSKNYLSFIFSIFLLIVILFVSQKDISLKSRYVDTFINSGTGIELFKLDEEKNTYELSKNITRSLKDTMWGAHYLTALQIFKDNPITGTGVKTFKFECNNTEYDKKVDSRYKFKRCSTHPHNYYLEILSDTGAIGFLYFTIILLTFYFIEIKEFLKKKDTIQGLLFLTIFVNLWPIASTGSIYSSLNGIFIWFTIGLIFSYKKLR